MTLSTQSTKAVAQGNGATTVWPYTFLIPSQADLVVTVVTLATGAESIIGSSLYTVTGIGNAAGGNVTYPLSGSPLSSAFDIVIQRTVPYTQETDLVNQGAVYPADIEDALDFLTMQTQQLNEQLVRAMKFDLTDTTMPTLPPAAARASKYLSFDSSGNPTVSALAAGSVTISAPMIPVVGAVSTAAALALLGVNAAMLTFVNSSSLANGRATLGLYDTFALAAAATISSSINFLYLSGYTTVGDLGGGFYKRVVGGSVQLTSADGAQWRLIETVLTPQMFGGVVGGNISTSLQAAFNAAAALGVRRVFIPAGSYTMTVQAAYITTAGVVSIFAPGIEVFGAGRGATIIDNRVAAAVPMLSFSNSTANVFQLGTFIHDFTITNSTSVANTRGLELKAVYNTMIQRIHFHGNAIGAEITSVLGDADAANVVVFDNCRFENGVYGLFSNYTLGVTQPSFVRVQNSFFTGYSAAGWYYIGLQGSCSNCAFAANTGIGLHFAYNNANNAQFAMDTVSFENSGTTMIRVDSLIGFNWRAVEISGTVFGSYPGTVGIDFGGNGTGSVLNGKVDSTRFRMAAAYNPYTAYNLGATSANVELSNTDWSGGFDTAGQVRYADTGLSNRCTDDSTQYGQYNGISSIALVNGANNNFAFPLDGNAFRVVGPTGAFNLTGITNGTNGRRIYLQNTVAFAMTFVNESGASAANNRINFDGTIGTPAVNVGGTVELIYWNQRWHIVGNG